MTPTRLLQLSALGLTLHFAPVAHATVLDCTGTVDAVQSGAAGTVLVKPSWRGDWVQLCSAAAVWKGVTVDSCKRWAAAAMLAYVTGSPTSLHYDTATAASCDAMATGANADGATQFINQ